MGMNPIVDLSPTHVERLPRGVHPCREYRVFNHERDQWGLYREFLYETAHGIAHIVLAPGRNLQQGMATADRLLKEGSASTIFEDGIYGTVNSVRNYENLCSGSLLALAVARSGVHTEWSLERARRPRLAIAGKDLEQTHESMVNRPALVFPYEPFTERSQRRIKPGQVPTETKQQHAAPFASRNELFLAGKIANRWSDAFHQSVLGNVNYHLWITNNEKDAMCLSLLPMLLGLKMDVIGIPRIGFWGREPGKGDLRLPSELEAYRFRSAEGARRLVGIAFDQESWRNPTAAGALLRLCKTLRDIGALVFVAVIPPGYPQNGVADFFAKHCVPGDMIDFAPILDLLNRSVHVDQDYEINFPAPDVSCRLKSLGEQAEAFFEVQERLKDKTFAELPSGIVDQVVVELGRLAAEQKDADSYFEAFRALSLEDQTSRWAGWMAQNPFQTELDRELDVVVPPALRGRSGMSFRFCFEEAANNRLPPEKLKETSSG